MNMNVSNILQWLLYFYIYCFLGWIFESCYVSARKKRWTNRGFLRGPMLPIYGSGAVMMLVVSEPFRDNYILTYFAGVVGATALEYVVGVVIEAIFKVRYWDYSDQKFNYRGYICLSSSIVWGFLTIGMNAYLHPAILSVLNPVPLFAQQAITVIVTLFISVDTVLSVKDALELRDIILRLEEARKEMELLQRRMDVVLAFAEEDKEQFLEGHPRLQQIDEHITEQKKEFQQLRAGQKKTMSEHWSELKDKLELSLDAEKGILPKLPEKQQLELHSIRDAFRSIEQTHERVHSPRTKKHHRKRLLGNPGMRSLKHSEALETLRNILTK